MTEQERRAGSRGWSFRARVEPVSGGGHYVPVPPRVAERAGLRYRDRVRGTVDGVPYQSSLMKYGGVFHLGIHNATLRACARAAGDAVRLTIEKDPEPPGGRAPPELAAALASDASLREKWARLAPSRRREHIKHISGAIRQETRERRLARLLDGLRGAENR